MQQLMILLVINSSSTCFGRIYAHRQEVRLRFHCLSFSVLLWLLWCWRVGWQAVCTVWSRLLDMLRNYWLPIKSLIVASSWSRHYLLRERSPSVGRSMDRLFGLQAATRLEMYTQTNIGFLCYVGSVTNVAIRVGLRPLAWWDCWFESRRDHGFCLLWVMWVVQTEASVQDRSLIQGSPTEYGVCPCVRSAATITIYNCSG